MKTRVTYTYIARRLEEWLPNLVDRDLTIPVVAFTFGCNKQTAERALDKLAKSGAIIKRGFKYSIREHKYETNN